MIHTRTSRTLAATGVTAALLCAPPAAGHTVPTGSCDRLRDGQSFIDWARAQGTHNGHTQSARPSRRAQPLDSLLRTAAATDGK